MKKNASKQTKWVRLLAFLIPTIAIILGLKLGGFSPFGSRDLFTATGQESAAVRYFEFYDRVHSGKNILLNTTTGLGEDYTGTMAFYLADPLNLIALLFPRTMLLTMLHLLFAVKMGLAGLFASIYLSWRRKKVLADQEAMNEVRRDAIAALAEKEKTKKEKKLEKLAASGKKAGNNVMIGGRTVPAGIWGRILTGTGIPELAFSMVYVLSQYLLGTGTNPSYASSFMLLPLIILGLERLIEEGRWGLFAVTYALSFPANFHGALMITVFLVLFFAFYSFRSLPNFLRSLKLFLLSILLAVGSAAVIIIPAFGSVAGKGILSSKFMTAYFSTGIFDNLKSFLAGTAPSRSLMYGHNLDMYCGIFTLFLLVLFLLNPHIKTSTRVRDGILLLILWSGSWLFTTNHLLNGLFYFNHFTVAYGFIFTFFAMRMIYTAFLNFEHTRSWHLHTGLLLVGAMAISSMFLCDRYDSIQPLALSLELLLAYYIAALLYKSRSLAKHLFYPLFALIMLGELVILFPANMKKLNLYAPAITKTVAYSNYETARLLNKERPGSRIEIYDSSASYATPVTEALMDYHYVIARKGALVNSGLTELGDVSYSTLYQNTNAQGARFTTARLDQYSYNRMYPFVSSNILAETYLGGDPVFLESSGQAMPMTAEESVMYYVLPDEGGDLYALLNYVAHLSEEAVVGETLQAYQLYPDIHYTNEYMQVYRFDAAAFQKMLQDFTPVFFPKFTGHIRTFVTVPDEGYLVIPVPKLPGISVKVADKKVEPVSFMDEGMVIPIMKGEIKIEVFYIPVFLITGSIISAVFLLALVLLLAKKVFSHVEEKETRVSRFLRENWVYFAAFSIPFFGMLLMAAFTGCYPFGQRFLLPGDTFAQTYPGYVQSFLLAKNNQSTADLLYATGLAMDHSASIAYTIISPWGLIINKLIPASLYQLFFSMDYLIYFALAPLSLIFYLTHRRSGLKMKKTDSRLLILSMVYVFSACSLAFWGYYGFRYLLFFPLILLGLEAIVYEKKNRLYIFVLWYLMIQDAYYAFIACEIIACFFLMQNFDSMKHFLRSAARWLLSSLLAAGLSALWLLPYYLRTTNSTYVEKDGTIPALTGWFTSLRKVFGEYRLSSTVTTTSALSYKANLYCGMAILLLLPLYALNKKIKLHTRLRHLGFLLLLFLSFDSRFLNYVFHGFHMQSLAPNRYVFAFVLLLIIMAYDTMLHFDGFRPKTVFLSILGMGVFYLIASVPESRADYFYKATIVFILLQVLFAGYYLIRKNKDIYKRLFTISLVAELLFAAIPGAASTMGHSSAALVYAADIDRLTANHPEMTKELVLTEDIGSDNYNLGQLTNINTMSAFSSWMTLDHITLLRKWNVSCSLNCIYYLSGSLLSDMLFRVNYHTVNTYETSSASYYPVIDQVNNVELHQNPYALPLGLFIKPTNELYAWDAEDNYNDNKGGLHQNDFVRIMGGSDIYQELPMVKSPSENSAKENYMRINSETYQGSLDNTLKLFRFYISEDVEGQIFLSVYNYIIYIGDAVQGEHDVLELYLPLLEDTEEKIPEIHLYTADYEAVQEIHDILGAHTMTDTKLNGSTITGKIEAPEDGMVFLSLPHLPGFHAFVDGREADTSTFLGGIGIPVTAGSHSIKLSYTPSGFMPGIIITGISFLILIGWWILGRKKKKAAGQPAAERG